MAFDVNTFDAMLKPVYDKASEIVIKDFALTATIKRTTNFVGKNITVPFYYGNNPGRNRTFANSQTYSDATSMVDATYTRKKDYCPAFISRELLDASVGDLGSALNAAKHALDDAMLSLAKNIEASLFRDSSGIIARLDGSTPTVTLQLRNRADIVNFELKQPLKLGPNSDGSSLRAGVMVITGINEETGVITAAGNVTGSANDYVLIDGDATLSLDGLTAWCPEVVPATAFHGIPNRQVETARLAGIRLTPAPNSSLKSIIRTLSNRMVSAGANPKVCYIGTDGWDKLCEDLGNAVLPGNVKSSGKGEWGFEGISIVAGKATVKVVHAPQCPGGVLFVADPEKLEFRTLGPAPRLQEMSGMGGAFGRYFQAVYNSDSVEARAVYYGEFIVHDPRAIGRASFTI